MNNFFTEFRKILNETLTYYPDFIVSIIVNIILFTIFFNNNQSTSSILGFVLWIIVSGVISEASITISTEKQLGTLQNLMIKPVSILSTITNKTISWIIINTVKIVSILLILSIFYNLKGVFNLHLIIIFPITILGIFGFSLILAVLTLIYTKVASFEAVISYILLYLSGTFLDIPHILIYSNPLSYATYAIKNINIINIENYIYLILISLLWLIIGLASFKYIFAKSKNFNWNY